MIEKRASSWCSRVTVGTKRDGTPRFCVVYRHTTNVFLVRESWSILDIESRIHSAGDTHFILVFDVHLESQQLPIKHADVPRTACLTAKGICFCTLTIQSRQCSVVLRLLCGQNLLSIRS